MLGLESGGPFDTPAEDGAHAAAQRSSDGSLEEPPVEPQNASPAKRGSEAGLVAKASGFEEQPRKRARKDNSSKASTHPPSSGMPAQPLTPTNVNESATQATVQGGVGSNLCASKRPVKVEGNEGAGELTQAATAILRRTLPGAESGGSRAEARLRTVMRPVFRSSVRWFQTALQDLSDYSAVLKTPGLARATALPARDWEADFEGAPDVPRLMGLLSDFDREYAALLAERARAVNQAVASSMEAWNAHPAEGPAEEARPVQKARGPGGEAVRVGSGGVWQKGEQLGRGSALVGRQVQQPAPGTGHARAVIGDAPDKGIRDAGGGAVSEQKRDGAKLVPSEVVSVSVPDLAAPVQREPSFLKNLPESAAQQTPCFNGVPKAEP